MGFIDYISRDEAEEGCSVCHQSKQVVVRGEHKFLSLCCIEIFGEHAIKTFLIMRLLALCNMTTSVFTIFRILCC